MIALFLSVACSVTIAFILKFNEERAGDRMVVLAGNYLMAAFIGGMSLLSEPQESFTLDLPILLFGMLVGVGFVVAFFAYMKSVKEVGVALATLIARISIVVPLILSATFYREIPTPLQFTGILITFITIYLFTRSIRGDKTKTYTAESLFYIFLLFFMLGFNDFSMKVFQEWQSPSQKSTFLFILFGMAALITWIWIAVKRSKIKKFDLGLGCILGVPNMFASYFLIDALQVLPGILVYPLVNVSIIGLTVLGGILLWREKINRLGWISLIFAAVAITLLSI